MPDNNPGSQQQPAKNAQRPQSPPPIKGDERQRQEQQRGPGPAQHHKATAKAVAEARAAHRLARVAGTLRVQARDSRGPYEPRTARPTERERSRMCHCAGCSCARS